MDLSLRHGGARPGARGLRRALSACTLVLAGILASPAQVRAQYVFDDAIMPARAVAWRLADRGFTDISRPRFDGRTYIVEAFSPGGARVRLMVDPENGAILARHRVDDPDAAVFRPLRPAPGYGWTEEDETRRPARQAERLMPPADIPDAALPRTGRNPYPARPLPGEPRLSESRLGESRSGESRPGEPRLAEPPRREARIPRADPARVTAPETGSGSTAGPNPLGLNPDAAGRTPVAPVPKAVARVAPRAEPKPAESRPAAVRATPDAPKAAATDAHSDAPKPAAASGVPEAKPVETRQAKSLETSPAEAKAGPTWKDPPEGKRNVRVIGGATIVPGGSGEKDSAPAQ